VHQLFIDFKRTYDPVRREVLFNILIEFVIPMKLARLIKMCLNETDSRVRVGNICLTFFDLRIFEQGDALSPLPFNFALG
jgi:hypothetical protein